MTSANPPYPYFNGITYNSQYFASSGSGLTQAQANALYLRKTTADTATALETFSAGIVSNSFQSTTATTDMSVGSSQTDGILNLGTGARTATGVINIGTDAIANNTTKTVNINGSTIGSGKRYLTRIGGINFDHNTGGQEINGITVGAGEPISFLSQQTAGAANFACGAVTRRTGAVNIGSLSTNACAINLANIAGTSGLATSGSVNIANGTGTAGTLYTTTVGISSGTTTGAVTIGSTSNTTTISSLTTNLITGVGTSPVPIAGTVNVATGTGTGFVSTAVNIASGATTGTTTIGNSANTTDMKSKYVNIGSVASLALDAEVNIANISGTALLPTGGSVNIANGTGPVNGYTTGVNIATGTTSGFILMGNASQGTTISSGTTTINGTLAMGPTRNFQLKTDGVAPSADTQLGYLYSNSLTGTTLTSSPASISSFKPATSGVYIVSFNWLLTFTGGGTVSLRIFSGATTGAQTTVLSEAYGYSMVLSNQVNITGSTVLNLSNALFYTLVVTYSGIAATAQAGNFRAVRIG